MDPNEAIKMVGEVFGVEVEELPPLPPPQPLTEAEQKAIDEVIDEMRYEAKLLDLKSKVSRPVFINVGWECRFPRSDVEACEKLDDIIAKAFDKLRQQKIDDFSEKLYDRLMKRALDGQASVNDGHGVPDGDFGLGILSIRLMNTMEYVVARKKSYRGVPVKPYFDDKTTITELKARKLLKK
jgi:hypothetical protein